jgi:predicted transposase YbfD/YdcC
VKPDPVEELLAQLATMPDHRKVRPCDHPLINVVFIAICAALGGADDWEAVEEFGKAKTEFFSRYLDLTNGIPSHDTFNRFFRLLDPEVFAMNLKGWMGPLCELAEGEVVALDGKTQRRSFDRGLGLDALHMVSAFATQRGLALAQLPVRSKENEIVALPKLIEMLHLKGCVVTIDAMGCQKDIAGAIQDKGADYVLALKDNHPVVHQEVQDFFSWAENKPKYTKLASFEDVDKGHGRIETRRTVCSSDLDWFEDRELWPGLESFVLVHSERIVDGKRSEEQRYYLSSLPARSELDAKRIAESIRGHWGIENRLHWLLDVVMREDFSRVRLGHGPQNFAMLRKVALNLLRSDTKLKGGITAKRRRLGWNDADLARFLHANLFRS